MPWYAHMQMLFMHVNCLQGDLVAAGVLSGNRNFEGRIHPLTRANYLASPPLVIAYALAGTVLIDFEKEPLGKLTYSIGLLKLVLTADSYGWLQLHRLYV